MRGRGGRGGAIIIIRDRFHYLWGKCVPSNRHPSIRQHTDTHMWESLATTVMMVVVVVVVVVMVVVKLISYDGDCSDDSSTPSLVMMVVMKVEISSDNNGR